MTSVKVKGFSKLNDELKKKILDAVDKSNFNERLAKDVAAKIRRDGIEPELAPSTVEYRSKIVSRKGPKFSAGRSSLTLSGQLLGALRSIFQKASSSFYFTVEDATHKEYKYKKKNGKTSKHGGNARLVDIFNGLMKDRPVTKVFDDKDFKLQTERRLIAAIKQYFK